MRGGALALGGDIVWQAVAGPAFIGGESSGLESNVVLVL